jgi:hypothetical protein
MMSDLPVARTLATCLFLTTDANHAGDAAVLDDDAKSLLLDVQQRAQQPPDRSLMRSFIDWCDAGIEDESAKKEWAVPPGAWISAPLQQRMALEADVLARAVGLTLVFSSVPRLQLIVPGLRDEVSTTDVEGLAARVRDRLRSERPVTLRGSDLWLQVQVERESIVLRAGRNPAERFADFEISFARGNTAITTVRAHNGVAHVTGDIWDQARLGEADRIDIRR